ncbi:hypothetical protein E2562_020850 [Oryza meyeriana var. granulata]|uniref:Uncharacterized protein n=1 Tax=Oryza meyeriana var. granulata TaxID=110450 RepID=A0A6G1FAQ5_9ORYZ|nr:hypothetical protein E2562_020850 [Oryza meyeriana var. granulata]
MAGFGQTLGWIALHSDTPDGFNEQLRRLMWCLCYLSRLVYRGQKYEFGESEEWEVEVWIHPCTSSEPKYLFKTRYHRDTPKGAIQDATHEAFVQLHTHHREELRKT